MNLHASSDHHKRERAELAPLQPGSSGFGHGQGGGGVRAPRRGTTKAELEQVAKLYREHVEGRPVESIRTLMGYGSDRTAARRVEQARAAGLLPSTTPGKKKA